MQNPRSTRQAGRTSLKVTDHPVYWFSLLDQARERGDIDGAINAVNHLRRLGVTVSFDPQARPSSARQEVVCLA